ncbi:hypothetical protein IWW50_000312, partial [Coemansia erecta]
TLAVPLLVGSLICSVQPTILTIATQSFNWGPSRSRHQQQGIVVSGGAREQDGPVLYPAGWTARAKGALAGCILAALFGFATILWYRWSSSAKYQPVPETVAEN